MKHFYGMGARTLSCNPPWEIRLEDYYELVCLHLDSVDTQVSDAQARKGKAPSPNLPPPRTHNRPQAWPYPQCHLQLLIGPRSQFPSVFHFRFLLTWPHTLSCILDMGCARIGSGTFRRAGLVPYAGSWKGSCICQSTCELAERFLFLPCDLKFSL